MAFITEMRIVQPDGASNAITRLTWDYSSDKPFTVNLNDEGYRIEGMIPFIWNAGDRMIYRSILELLIEAGENEFHLDMDLIGELIENANEVAIQEARA